MKPEYACRTGLRDRDTLAIEVIGAVLSVSIDGASYWVQLPAYKTVFVFSTYESKKAHLVAAISG